MSSFVVINGERLSVDKTFKASKHLVEDPKAAKQRQQDADDEEERQRYYAHCQAQHEKHIEEMRQEEEMARSRRAESSKRQRFGDDYTGELDDEHDEEFMKKCRNAAADIVGGKADETLLPMSDFGQDAEWYIERESTAEKEKDFVHVMDPVQRDFESLLGEKEQRVPTECFACKYMTNVAANQLYMDQWVKVVRFWQQGFSVNMNYSSFGMDLHRVFTETVAKIMLKEGKVAEDEIVWSPYGILYHFLNHAIDPEIQTLLNVRGVDRAIQSIQTNELYLKHPSSGRVIVSKEALAKMKQAADIRLALAKPLTTPTPGGASGAASSSARADVHGAAKKQMYMASTKELVSRPNYMAPHSRHT